MKQRRQIAMLKRQASRRAVVARSAGKSANEIAADIRTASDGFLQGQEWRELRAKAVELYGVTCCACGAEQSRNRRVNMDHIHPRKTHPHLALDITNLQPLCGPCNRRKGNGPAVDYRAHAAVPVESPQPAKAA